VNPNLSDAIVDSVAEYKVKVVDGDITVTHSPGE
jgi:hypothetical protein